MTALFESLKFFVLLFLVYRQKERWGDIYWHVDEHFVSQNAMSCWISQKSSWSWDKNALYISERANHRISSLSDSRFRNMHQTSNRIQQEHSNNASSQRSTTSTRNYFINIRLIYHFIYFTKAKATGGCTSHKLNTTYCSSSWFLNFWANSSDDQWRCVCACQRKHTSKTGSTDLHCSLLRVSLTCSVTD